MCEKEKKWTERDSNSKINSAEMDRTAHIFPCCMWKKKRRLRNKTLWFPWSKYKSVVEPTNCSVSLSNVGFFGCLTLISSQNATFTNKPWNFLPIFFFIIYSILWLSLAFKKYYILIITSNKCFPVIWIQNVEKKSKYSWWGQKQTFTYSHPWEIPLSFLINCHLYVLLIK